MLQNAYFLAKIGADTAENEQHFAEILPIGRRVADRCPESSSSPRPLELVRAFSARALDRALDRYVDLRAGGSWNNFQRSTHRKIWKTNSSVFFYFVPGHRSKYTQIPTFCLSRISSNNSGSRIIPAKFRENQSENNQL